MKISVNSLKDFRFASYKFNKFFKNDMGISKQLTNMLDDYVNKSPLENFEMLIGENSIDMYSEDGLIRYYTEVDNNGEAIFGEGIFIQGNKNISFLLRNVNPSDERFSVEYRKVESIDEEQYKSERGVECYTNDEHGFYSMSNSITIKNDKVIKAINEFYKYDGENIIGEEINLDRHGCKIVDFSDQSNILKIRQDLTSGNKGIIYYSCGTENEIQTALTEFKQNCEYNQIYSGEIKNNYVPEIANSEVQ